MRTKAGLKKRKAAGYKLGRPKGFKQNTPIREGVRSFINWYRKFYNY